MNIQHLGYRILAQSRVHAARSHVWLKKQSADHGLNKGDIVRKWQEIRKNAEDIQNCADRVLVIASVAEDMCSYYKHGDKRIPREMLETAETELNSIPTAQDRLSRMEAMAQSWHSFGEDDVTKYLLQQIVASMDSIRNLDEDEQLRRVIQLADSLVDSDFASELAARIGQSGSSNLLAEVAVRTQKAQVLRKRPGELTRDSSLRYGDVREIMSLAADNLLTDIVSGKGRGIEQDSTIQQWLYSGTLFDSSMMVSICKWIVESSHRGSTTKRSNPAMFFELCHFAQQLSELTNASSIVGIPDSLHSNFAGLNSKYVEFRSGERKQAQKWLSTWLRDNARKFLKIVDPYLGLEELAYLNYVPENCIILVITTSQKLKEDITVRDIECYWHECVSSREMPYTRILVVPEHYENALHDRVIVTQEAGIDLGCSLNTLGKSAVKMALLPKDEAEN